MAVVCTMFFILFMTVLGLIPKSTIAAGTPVKNLPGFHGQLPFELETGYIGVGQSEEVQFFYYFIKSESTVPENDPLFIWLVGGPGCSVIFAICSDIGPLRFDGREYNGSLPTLSYNPYGFTQVANIIFIDQPVGTGFSYSRTEDGKHSDNLLTAEHVYQFIRKWLVENPQYQSNPFYVGGSSYAGMIVPIISQVISDGNEAAIFQPQVNLKGYLLGNPITFLPGENNYQIPFAHGMALISDELYESLERHCGGEYQNIDSRNTLCLHYVNTFNKLLTGIYDYHILEPVCDSISTEVQKYYSTQRRSLDEKINGNFKSHPIGLPEMKCRENYKNLANFWANDSSVKEALHIRTGTIGVWIFCNKKIPFTMNINNAIPYHQYLSTKGYKSLIYNGDHDKVVTFQSTQAWIRSLNYSIIDDWRPWISDGQIAGYTRTYSNGMTFATVKGAGHVATETNPAECFTALKRWLTHEPL